MGFVKPTEEPFYLESTHLPKCFSSQALVLRPLISLLFVSCYVLECIVNSTPILNGLLNSTLQQLQPRVGWCFM